MKKLLAIILTIAALMSLFAGCSEKPTAAEQDTTAPSVTDPTTTPSVPDDDQPSDPTPPENKDTITVYANVPVEWATPYCWAWTADSNAFDEWPGEAMTKSGDWYTIEVPNWVENVIISNNGTPQTKDLAISKGSDAWVVVSYTGVGTVYTTEPDLSQSTGSELEAQLDEDLKSLLSPIGSVLDLSAYNRKTYDFSPYRDTNRDTILTAIRDDVSLSSAKVGQHEFVGGAEITVSQLMAEGWSYGYLDTEVNVRTILLAGCQTPSGETVEIQGLNNTDGKLMFKDCIVDGFSAQFHDLLLHHDDVSDLYINGAQVTKDTTLTQLLNGVGAPSEIRINQYHENGVPSNCYIYFVYDNLTVKFLMTQTSTTLHSITLENH